MVRAQPTAGPPIIHDDFLHIEQRNHAAQQFKT
jgi:hypothetical protein